ncbi:beta strand repeat-containing protein, partial [Zavarzinia sp.]|uniref:beta strand repeat-containing protein n=1 Tax=Zavarzinia sp. TaxID=2027920 RepID=UPI003BB6C286
AQGDGGTIVVWSDKATDFAGSARATGGAGGGDGGLIETSSMGKLDVSGAVINASAPAGKGGEWLLDPADIAIVNRGTAIPPDGVFIPADTSTISIESIFDVLKTGTNVSIVTNDPALKGDGNISYLANAAYDLGGVSASLRLEAAGAIDWSGTLQVSNGTLGIDAQAGQGILWSGILDGSAAALTLKATAGGSIKIFDGKLIADTIDLRGCMTGAGGCGTDADPYGIGIQPTASGTSGSVPSIEIDADQLTLLGGLGGVGIDHGEDSESSINIAVGRNLHMQGYGFDPFHIGNGIFSPGATATVLITGAFRNSDLGALVGAPAGTDVPGLSETELLALGDFQSLTLRTGAASSTFDADEASGTASVLVGAAVPGGVSLDLPLDIFVEANDGGSFYLAPDVTISSGGNVSITTSGAAASAALLGATTLSGDLTVNSAHIVLAHDLDIGGDIQMNGDVAVDSPAIAIKAGGDLDIAGTLDGYLGFSTPAIPDVTLTAASGLVRIGGGAGFGVGLGSLSVTAVSIDLAGVSTTGDQTYEAAAINLFGRAGSGIDYLSAAGDITVGGRTRLTGDIAMTATDGDIRFSGNIQRSGAADTASLALTAGGSGGEIVVGGDIGNVEGLLDGLNVSATRAFTLHDVRTSGDQTYAAPLGRFMGETYRTTTGDIVAAATTSALISGVTEFDAGGGASFGRIDAVSDGDAALTVIARDGSIGFLGDIGHDTRLGFLSASATDTISAADMRATGNIELFATDIRFTGASFVAGGDFLASGRMTIDQDAMIVGGTLVLLDGDIDLASAGDAGLSIVTEAGNAILIGDVGGVAALGYLDIVARDGIRLGNVRTTGDQHYAGAATGLRGSSYITDGDFTIVGETTIKDSVGVFAGGDIDIGDRLDVDELSPPEAVTRFEASAGGSLTIAGPIGGLSPIGTLDLRAIGDVAVGAIDVTGALRVAAGGILHLLDSHVRAGATIDMRGDVRLRYDTEIDARGDVTIDGPIDADGESDGIPSLAITSEIGAVRVDGAIGTRSAMTDIRVTAADTITLGDVASQGSQIYDGPVTHLQGSAYDAGRGFTVTGDTEIAQDTTIVAGTNISFGGRIDASAPDDGDRPAAPSLTAEAGGTLSVADDIGGLRILGDVDLSADGDVLVRSVAATGAISIAAGQFVKLATSTLDAGTDITLLGAVSLLGDALMRAGDSVSVQGTIDARDESPGLGAGSPAAGPAPNLEIDAAAGDVRITGAVGAVAAPGDVSISAGGAVKIADIEAGGSLSMLGAAITFDGGRYVAGGTFGAQGPVTMTRATTVTAGGDMLFGGTIDMLPGLDGGDA